MASAAVIGALRVVLGADTAALETGLKNAQSKLDGFGSTMSKVGLAAAAAFAAAGAGIGLAIKGSIDEADKLGKMSQSIGVPVDELSKLKYAADLSDVSLESLGISLGKLAKNMSAFAGGAGGPAADAFKALGISVKNTDGTLKSSSLVLGEIAGKFKGYEDGAAKTALAIALFGKAGAAMIPLLNQGKDGLAQASEEAEKFGIVIDKKTAAAAELFNDNLKRMSAITHGMWTQVTAQMLPAFMQLSKVFLENKENSALMTTAAEGLVTALRTSITIAVTAFTVFQRLGAEISAFWKVLAAPNWEGMKTAWANFNAEGDKTKAAFAALSNTVGEFWKDADVSMTELGKSAGPKMAAPIIEASEKAKNALLKFLDATDKQRAGLEAEAATIGKSAFETERLKISMEALTIAKNNNITVTESLRVKIDQMATAFATMSEKAKFGKQIFEQTRTPVEQYQIEIQRLNEALDRGAISSELYSRGVVKAQQNFAAAEPIVRGLGQSLETAFDKAITAGGKLSDIARQLLLDFARLLANQAFKNLLYGSGSSGGLFGLLFSGFSGGASGYAGGTPGYAGDKMPAMAGMSSSAMMSERVSADRGMQYGGPMVKIYPVAGTTFDENKMPDGSIKLVQRMIQDGIKSYDQKALPSRLAELSSDRRRR